MALAYVPLEQREVHSFPEAISNRERLERYSRGTWNSIAAMVQPDTGLPYDRMNIDPDGNVIQEGHTSPTNIGYYLLSTLSAEQMEFIPPIEATSRISQTLATLEAMQSDESSPEGLFRNWYDSQSGLPAQEWQDGVPVEQFLSSVDNGILGLALMGMREYGKTIDSDIVEKADNILKKMNFSLFLNSSSNLLHGRYDLDTGELSSWHYDLINTDGRLAAVFGIAEKDLPPEIYLTMGRISPAGSKDYSSLQTGYYIAPDGSPIVRSWNATGFEAGMGQILVPEAEWGTSSWALNHPRYMREQITYGKEKCNGSWGFSSCFNAHGSYGEFGSPSLGMNPARGLPDTVSPHAIALALPFAPEDAYEALRNLENVPNLYDDQWGFGDGTAVDPSLDPDHPSTSIRSMLDQGMFLLSAFNHQEAQKNTTGGYSGIHKYTAPPLESKIMPLMQSDNFYTALAA